MYGTRSEREFEAELQVITDQHLKSLYQIWRDMGWDSVSEERMTTVKDYIDESFKRMVTEEQGHLNQLLDQITTLDAEVRSLLKELGRKCSQHENKYNNSQVALLQVCKDLTTDVEGLREEKEKRMEEVSCCRDIYGQV